MFKNVQPKTTLQSAFVTAELIYHEAVRSVRGTHGNALIALLMNLLTALIMVISFFIMFELLGLRGAALRGDFLLYVMTGIFLFLCHTQALAAVAGAGAPTSSMMQHAPMNSIIAIAAAALGKLYINTLTLFIALYGYHVLMTPITIFQPIPAFGMYMLAWFSGCALGLTLVAIRPWFPEFVKTFTTVYQRASMIASGKMFVANTLPSFMVAMFDWHPLFHVIDQIRGFTFINYFPRNSDWTYTLYLSVIFLVVGMMAEFYTRQRASLSWSARR